MEESDKPGFGIDLIGWFRYSTQVGVTVHAASLAPPICAKLP